MEWIYQNKIKVIYGLNSLSVGGMERQFVEQMHVINRDKFDIHLILLRDEKDKPNFIELLPEDLPITVIGFSNFFDIRSWVSLFKKLKEIKPHIVVTSLFFSNTVFRVLKIFLGYKIISREHNTYYDKRFLERIIDKLLSLITYRIVAVSNTVAKFTSKQEKISINRFMVINNGINLKKVEKIISALPDKLELRRKMGFSQDDIVFLNIARLVPQKNHKLLLEAFSLLDSGFKKNIKLVIVGDGVLRDGLERFVKDNDLDSSVFFVGFKEDVWLYYKLSDIFISTSKMEGFSNAYLEAMACGLPVLSTKTAGSDELIREGKNGFFLEEEPEKIASFISNLSELEIENMKKEIKPIIMEYDINIVTQKYEDLFIKALDN